MTSKHIQKVLAAATITLAACSPSAHAQSGDALIDKLVEKGILTVKEANDLREETEKNFNQAYSVKSGMPDWVTALKFNGDFRGRFEENNAVNEEYHTRDRFRYRIRFGVTASLVDNFDITLRLASGNPQTAGGNLVGGQSISANTDLNSLESRKFIWVDAANAKWTPILNANWSLSATIGKMDNPFQFSNMIFDYDIDPEGAAFQFTHNFSDKHLLKGIGAAFVLDEINQGVGAVPDIQARNDPYMYGGQLLLESKWSPKIESSLGVAALNIVHSDSLSALVQPFYNSGNTRLATTGQLKYHYNPVIGTASATYTFESFPFYTGRFPIKLLGEYMENPAAPSQNEAYRVGVLIGKAGHKKTWEISYRYQRLEGDSWFDAFPDDDNSGFYAIGNPVLAGTGKANGIFGGTNVKGHQFQGTYSFTDYLNFTFTYYLNELIINSPGQNSRAGHFMADIMWKF